MARKTKKKKKLFSAQLALIIGIIIVIALAILGTSGNISNFYAGMLKSGTTSGTGAKFGLGQGGISVKPPAQPVPENTDAACSDKLDNDLDKAADCADADCDGKVCANTNLLCPPGCSGGGPDKRCKSINGNRTCNQLQISELCAETDCADNVDNDNSGAADCADADCNGQVCKMTQPPAGAGGQVRTDTCSGGACIEGANPWTEITCNDGIDNELDGVKDCADADCNMVGVPPCEFGKEIGCGDDFDNDADGLIDCRDKDCDKMGICEFGQELSCNDNADNDYDWDIDAYDTDCPSPDLVPIEVDRSTTQSGYRYKIIVKNQGDADAGTFLSVVLLNASRSQNEEIGIGDPDIRTCSINSLKAGATGYCTNETAIKTSGVYVAVNVFSQVTEGRGDSSNNGGWFDVIIE